MRVAIVEYNGSKTLAQCEWQMEGYYRNMCAVEWQLFGGELVLSQYVKVITELSADDLEDAVRKYPEVLV